jgi:hypothetical protein
VIAVAKSSDLVVMVLDAGKEEGNNHRWRCVRCPLRRCLSAPVAALRQWCVDVNLLRRCVALSQSDS